MMPKEESPKILWPEFGVGLSFVLFRIATCPPDRLWRDWLFLLGLFGLYRAFLSRSASFSTIIPMLIAYLLAVQVMGQLPHTLTVLGIL